MGWGVLQDPRTPFPTGTVKLEEKEGLGMWPRHLPPKRQGILRGTVLRKFHLGDDLPDVSGLKKKGNVVLQPQPGDDPNDPLNWWVDFLSHVSSSTPSDSG